MILWLANYFIELFIIEETLESNASVCKIYLAVIPAKAGIQTIIKFPTEWGQHLKQGFVRCAACLKCWIPAFAGMTAIIKIFVMNYGNLNKL